MKTNVNSEIGKLFGELYSFNESLKLFHWHDTGEGSYARHMATDQAVDSVRGLLDRLVETSYSVYGDINIVVPETKVPECLMEAIKNGGRLIKRLQDIFEESFLLSILDDYQEALHQLNYRITRLK